MDYRRMPIEIESPEQLGYSNVRYNLTESSVSDTLFDSFEFKAQRLKLAYSDHLGKPELRELIANSPALPGSNSPITKDNVLITAGAASALFIVATSLLEKEDHLIVIRPNYASNIETPRAIGCEITCIDLKFENSFLIPVEEIQKSIRPNTKLISITNPHNPTGMVIPEDTLRELANIAEKNNVRLLVDETYRELNFGKIPPIAASIHPGVISVSSVSKAFGLPGIRIGWVITQNKSLFEKFLAAKEQIFLCNSVIDEEIAYQFLLKKEVHFAPITEHIRTNLKILKKWLAEESRMEVVLPEGGVVCFPRIKNTTIDTKKFYEILNNKYGTFVGPGHWFEMPDNYMRIGYGWPAREELAEGLANVSRVLDELKR